MIVDLPLGEPPASEKRRKVIKLSAFNFSLPPEIRFPHLYISILLASWQ
jgi:hypothetical protein